LKVDLEAVERPVHLKEKIRSIMTRSAWVIREGKGLRKGLSELICLRKKAQEEIFISSTNPNYNKEWVEALKVQNMLTVAEMIVRAALYRTESRGAHYRSDYPETDEVKWLRNVIIRRDGRKMKIFTEPVVRM